MKNCGKEGRNQVSKLVSAYHKKITLCTYTHISMYVKYCLGEQERSLKIVRFVKSKQDIG